MQKEFIPYEQALELKELGFDEPCFSIYILALIEKGKALRLDNIENHNVWDDKISAPIYQQAFRWFREKYKLWGSIGMQTDDYYTLVVYENSPNCSIVYNNKGYETYEEAELACLRVLIEIVKEK